MGLWEHTPTLLCWAALARGKAAAADEVRRLPPAPAPRSVTIMRNADMARLAIVKKKREEAAKKKAAEAALLAAQ